MDFKLNIKQDIKLILTQEMQMSINLLGLSSLNLKELIEKEGKENPAIELVYSKPHSRKTAADEERTPLDLVTQEETLTDILEEQIGYLTLTPQMKYICTFIVNNLDNRGYLSLPKDEIMSILSINTVTLKEAFSYIHTLDPAGIAAENLQECLKIQLQRKDIKDPYIYRIIDYHLEDLAGKDFDYIAETLKISTDDVREYLKEIQKLSPIPARGYTVGGKSDYIIPDVTVSIVGNEPVFTLNEDLIPKVYINTSYNPQSEKEKKYLERAEYIRKSIEKRYETLTRIMEIIVERQQDYFLRGRFYLQTLTIRDTAHELELHESTVSRAVKDKFINSPQGIISMRSLFILDASVIKIKKIIEDLIENENKKRPLSDASIVKSLENAGFVVARRTVAKYREEIGYPSSRDRKK